jgi:hypothetical protein
MTEEVTYEKHAITIDNVEYYYEDLPEVVQHSVTQLSHCTDELNRLKLELQRVEMQQIGYTTMLKEGMEQFKSGE